MNRFITTTAALIATITLAACGEDENRPATVRADTTDRYCALTRAMDAAGSKFFARLERKDASAKQFEEIERAAPAALRADMQILLAGQRRRAGLGGSVDEAQVGAAEKRVKAYEQLHCD